jgi:hypothetical protein
LLHIVDRSTLRNKLVVHDALPVIEDYHHPLPSSAFLPELHGSHKWWQLSSFITYDDLLEKVQIVICLIE